MLTASAVFRVAPDATAAADVVGAMLTRWHYIALAAPLAIFALELRHGRRLITIVTFVALVIAAAQAVVDLRVRAIREMARPHSVSSLAPTNPLRRQFGALHGVSMALHVMQVIAAAVVVGASDRRRPLAHREHVAVDVDLVERESE